VNAFSRRHFLRGVGGAAVALPLLHSLGCKRSDPTPSARERIGQVGQRALGPQRLMIVYIPNGNIGHELPGSMSFAGSILEPLAPFASKMNILRGLDLSVHDLPPGEPHQQGMALLTGRPLNPGTQQGGDGTLAGWASGISVDQRVASTTAGLTAHKSLHLGVQSTHYGGTEVRTVLSYAGSDQPIGNDTSPATVFDLVFSDLGADPLGLAKKKARRKSILDAVGGEYAGLGPRLSSDDKLKVERHLAAIREVEQALDNPGATIGGACQVPELGAGLNLDDPASYPVIGKLQMDLATMAFACDLTRVVTLQWSASTNNRPYPWLTYDAGGGPAPIEGDEHVLGHQPESDVHAWNQLRIIRRWYMEQFAYLLGKLDAIAEGEGTMLDNTVVMLCSEITRGNTHSHADAPFLLAGSAGGYFATGEYRNYPGTVPHNNLLVSLLNAMGVGDTTFGQPGYCTGALDDLRA
jgi:hypothetical protein